jgi:hypothetical protein
VDEIDPYNINEEDALIVSHLRKEYQQSKGGSNSMSAIDNVVIAVDDLCLRIQLGECFGYSKANIRTFYDNIF